MANDVHKDDALQCEFHFRHGETSVVFHLQMLMSEDSTRMIMNVAPTKLWFPESYKLLNPDSCGDRLKWT